ncbi:MAG: hypothetical protein D3924_09385 [Candidatus Electrothrix sp. AR4]|nr:hypothetical protein [Candidatus Electrothrix sp. AR4]
MIHSTSLKYPKINALLGCALAFSALFLVISTHPFLRLPYDPWEHLIKIRSIFDDGRCFLYWPGNESSFCTWHQAWALFFSILKINNTLLWAKIIHSAQYIFALLSLLYFSFSVFRLCEKQAPNKHLFILACFSTLYWLVGNGTYSVEYQQAWIMWYSVTYQGLTIPLFWLITGFTLQLFFNDGLSSHKKQFFVFLIIAGFLVIAFFHPSEAIYYCIFLVLSLLLTPLVSTKQKIIYGLVFITIIPSVLFVIATHMDLPFLHGVSTRNGLAEIIQQVNITGVNITERGGNRLRNSFSELAMLSSIAALTYGAITFFYFHKKKSNRPLSLLLLALILFYLIPTSKWIAGITGILLHENIVWRFFFASPWFLFIPFIIYKLTCHSRYPKAYVFFILFSILSVSCFASQTYFNKTLSGNIMSLYKSFFKEKVGLQYSDETLALLKETIEKKIEGAEKKEVMLYLRGDIATLSRALYGYYVFSHRRTFIPMHMFYAKQMERRYTLIPINLPLDFPKDRNIFLHFKLDAKRISCRTNIKLNGESSVLFGLEHVDLSESYLFIEGWAFLKGQLHQAEVYVVLQSEQEALAFDTSQLFRRDVGKHFKSMHLENNGFLATIKTMDLKPGIYRIGLQVKQDDQQGFILTQRAVKIPREVKDDRELSPPHG